MITTMETATEATVKQSDTPRTDEVCDDIGQLVAEHSVALVNLAKQLERELNECKDERFRILRALAEAQDTVSRIVT